MQAMAEKLAELLNLTVDEARLVLRGASGWVFLHWSQFRSIKTKSDLVELENIVREFYGAPPMSTLWLHHPWFTSRLDPEFVSWVHEVVGFEKERD